MQPSRSEGGVDYNIRNRRAMGDGGKIREVFGFFDRRKVVELLA